jgi:hypothetical protein
VTTTSKYRRGFSVPPQALVALLAAVLAITASAAPPPGHPGAAETARILGLPEETPNNGDALIYQGEVVQAMDANAFTYIEVLEESATGPRSRWIVAPKTKLRPGLRIRFGNGQLMAPFYSKKLKMSFESVLFVGPISIQTDDHRAR